MHCHACGTETQLSGGQRIGFSEECDHCQADLHCCLNCAHHDPTAYNECRESNAERVTDRERANRCEYFRPGGTARPGGAAAGGEANGTRARAKAELEALFKK